MVRRLARAGAGPALLIPPPLRTRRGKAFYQPLRLDTSALGRDHPVRRRPDRCSRSHLVKYLVSVVHRTYDPLPPNCR